MLYKLIHVTFIQRNANSSTVTETVARSNEEFLTLLQHNKIDPNQRFVYNGAVIERFKFIRTLFQLQIIDKSTVYCISVLLTNSIKIQKPARYCNKQNFQLPQLFEKLELTKNYSANEHLFMTNDEGRLVIINCCEDTKEFNSGGQFMIQLPCDCNDSTQ